MTRTQRAGWALLGVGILLWLAAMALYAFTGTDMLKDTALVTGPIITAALAMLGYAYRGLVMTKNGDDG